VFVCPLLAALLALSAAPAAGRTSRAQAPKPHPAEQELRRLAKALCEKDTQANYDRLAAYARKRPKHTLGARAALALGHRDLKKNRLAEARRWLELAKRDDALFEYVRYGMAQTDRAAGNNARALAQFEAHRNEFPESVMAPQAVQAIAELALAAKDPARALKALDAYVKTLEKTELLLLRARAREQAGHKLAAAADYVALYYEHPLSDEADAAGKRIAMLERVLGENFPSAPMAQRLARAAALFEARQWKQARQEHEVLAAELTGAARERAQLRVAQCRVQLNAPIAVLADPIFSDPDVEGERLSVLAQLYRARKNEGELLAAAEEVARQFPQSRWTEEALFTAGNYFWSNRDRVRAVQYYQRLLDAFPGGKNILAAQWRVAWLAYLERRPEAARLIEEHLRRFPGSSYTTDALYWLGRLAERAGNAEHARAFFLKLAERFPQTYFGLQATERLRALGPGLTNSSDLLALIPSLPSPPQLDETIPAAAMPRWERARALRMIGFDASAELELRAANAVSNSPRLLLEAGQAALEAGRLMPAVSAARQAVPQLEARRWEEVPEEVWRLAFPYIYGAHIEKYAQRNALDPMLVAALIRQESVFQPDAVSRAGAVGLMQVLPLTGRKLARSQKLRYTRARLMQPEYNVQLGTAYLRNLVKTFGSLEAALAAYNAGEDRVELWRTEREYEEMPEFVESIPFTETREYVQIVLRNAEIYRRLYARNGSKP